MNRVTFRVFPSGEDPLRIAEPGGSVDDILSLVESSVVVKAGGAEARPNGPMLMNRTLMQESMLPPASKHIDGATLTADWEHEYPTGEPPAVAPPPQQQVSEVANFHGTELVAASLFGAGLVLTALF